MMRTQFCAHLVRNNLGCVGPRQLPCHDSVLQRRPLSWPNRGQAVAPDYKQDMIFRFSYLSAS
jgi:hypothetical protein